MSNKGQRRRQKRISVQKAVNIPRKEFVWVIRTNPGPHKKELSAPLGVIVRNYLKITNTMKETKRVLSEGEIKVDGVVRKDPAFCVGIFDVVSIEKENKHYRVLLDKKQRLYLKELKEKDNTKIARIEYKRVTSKGIQITTSDGRNFIGISGNVGDSVKINFEKNSIEKVLELKTGAIVYVVGGSHAGKIARVKEIIPGTQLRDKLVKLEQNGEEFETVVRNIFVIDNEREFE